MIKLTEHQKYSIVLREMYNRLMRDEKPEESSHLIYTILSVMKDMDKIARRDYPSKFVKTEISSCYYGWLQ